ncbi:MAG: monovalent cation/H+ antiporter subunit D family protein [Chitinispirillaceae bacterium]|nr:monovalent cation/H+ antiporter subunit D family protein [Chitinispirillaceae bacterium]
MLLGNRVRWISDILCTLCTFVLCLLSFYAIGVVNGHAPLIYKVGGWFPPVGICLVLDSLSCFMLVIVNSITLIVTIYSINYMERYTAKNKFYALFLLMLAGMNGVIVTGDMFNLFVFLEIGSIASYGLVAFGTEEEELEASFKYMIMGSIAGLFILLGIGLLYSYTSTLNMADMAQVVSEKSGSKLIGFVSVLFLVGFGLKGALFPFHWWLPDAHPSAPAPISAMLSGLLIKALGVYALIRVFFSVLDATSLLPVLMVLGTMSMVIGVFLAVGQWDFKRLLAYHSISQVGYIMLGIGLGTPLGIMGGLFHLFNHSMFKSLLFLNSGAVDYATGTRNLKELGGLRERMPISASTSMVASMSIAGLPPFNGFWSKLIIIIACVNAGRPVYAAWAVLASIMTLASFMKVQKYVFFGELKEKFKAIREVPFAMQFSMVLLALICFLGGLLLVPAVSGDFLQSAVDVITNGKEYAKIVFQSLR